MHILCNKIQYNTIQYFVCKDALSLHKIDQIVKVQFGFLLHVPIFAATRIDFCNRPGIIIGFAIVSLASLGSLIIITSHRQMYMRLPPISDVLSDAVSMATPLPSPPPNPTHLPMRARHVLEV